MLFDLTQSDKFEKYRKAYNDREAISYTQYLNFEARDYFKSINVFGGPDPISEEFPHVSSMNYAENSPVANIDLHGLQKFEHNMARRLKQHNTPSERSEEDWLGPAIGYTFSAMMVFSGGSAVVGHFGARTVGGFIGNEIKDEVLSQATGGLSDFADLSKLTVSGFKGAWRMVSENMSDAASSFQKQITGVDANMSFVRNDVKFDGVNADGVLLDAKSGMINFVGNDGAFKPWFQGADGLIDQAGRQLKAAEGTPIQWHFVNEEVMKATQRLFKENGVEGIELIHTPRN